MKRILPLLLCLSLLISLCGCKSKGPSLSSDLAAARGSAPGTANAACSVYLEELNEGEGLAAQLLSDPENEGIMAEVLQSFTYEVLSEEEQDDGSILCKLEITAIDMEVLLDDLPTGLASKAEAQAEMLDMAEDAERKTFEAELILVPSEAEGGYDLQYGNDFVNAITGGMLDLIIEAYDLEVAE